MAYTPTEWKSGDVITAEKLNNIEDGVASAGESDLFIVTITGDESSASADKTISEVSAAYTAGKIIVFKYNDMYSFATYSEAGGMGHYESFIINSSDLSEGHWNSTIVYKLTLHFMGATVQHGSI